MAAFTPERRMASNRAMIPPSGDRRRMAWSYDDKKHLNRDPITGAPGAHPVGTGLGAAAGGMAAGAAAGAVGGPIGAVAGAAVGAVVGGLAGKRVAENIDPTIEEAYWRENYRNRPYATKSDYTYDDYGPAYMYGVDNYSRYPGKSFDQVEGDLG